MPMYTPQEIKEKLGHGNSTKVEARKLEVKDNKKYLLWIPEAKFCGIYRHFRVRTVPGCSSSKVDAINCINQENDGKKCPICNHIKTLWEQYKKVKTKKEKTQILQQINGYQSTYYYVNVIDLADPEKRFKELSLTSGAMKQLNSILLDFEGDEDISDYIFTFKKSKVGNKISYIIIENQDKSITDKLKSELNELMDRPFEDGGLNPLEDIHRWDTDEEKYLAVLKGKTVNSDDTEEDKDDNVEIDVSDDTEEDADFDIDDIDGLDEGIDEKPKSSEKKSKKKTMDEELDDDLDDLDDFDDLDDDEETEEEVIITITPDYIRENKDDKNQMKNLIKFFGDKLEKKSVKALFNYVKSVKSVKIKEIDLMAPEF